ncbi:hypothetical protein RE6C_03397 [Rhodopirellula europaea 6C]|uniref:Uncharacterized protein n=1 Tax=Rhodopirellula europaea 6C TaxID=1263867 RepID=M2B1Z4_9BACT|nr:hypothetical protein RE6C_03397 [Rhodopirellula europaea 6C]
MCQAGSAKRKSNGIASAGEDRKAISIAPAGSGGHFAGSVSIAHFEPM